MRSAGGLSDGNSDGKAWGKDLRDDSFNSCASGDSFELSDGDAGLTRQRNVLLCFERASRRKVVDDMNDSGDFSDIRKEMIGSGDGSSNENEKQ